MTAARTEEISEFTMLATETAGCPMILEAAHTSDPSLDAAKILFETVVQVGTRSVPDRLAQNVSDRHRVEGIVQQVCTQQLGAMRRPPAIEIDFIAPLVENGSHQYEAAPKIS